MRSLRMKMVMIMVILILALMLTTGAFLMSGVGNFYVSQFYEQMEGTFTPEFIAQLQRLSAEDNAPAQMKELLMAQAGLGIDITGRNVYILDQNGSVLDSSNQRTTVVMTQNILSAMNGSVGQSSSVTNNYMDLAVPVESDGAQYIAYIRDNRATVDALTSELLIIILRALALGLVICVILSFLLSQILITPIRALTVGTKRVAAGDFANRVTVDSRDEIGDLTQNFNHMAKVLQDTISEAENERNKLSTLFLHMTDGVVAFNTAGSVIHYNPAATQMLAQNLSGQTTFDEIFSKEAELDTLLTLRRPQYIETQKTVGERELELFMAPFSSDHAQGGVLVVIHDVTEQRRSEQTQARIRRQRLARAAHAADQHQILRRNDRRHRRRAAAGAARELHERHHQRGRPHDPHRAGSAHAQQDRLRQDGDEHLPLPVPQSRAECLRRGEAQRRAEPPPHHDAHLRGGRFPTSTATGSASSRSSRTSSPTPSSIRPTAAKSTCTVGTSGKNVFVRVTDNGIGIPEKDLPRLFDRFYRVDKARSRESGGTGLGLSIAQEILNQHKGRIEISSEYGKGTSVLITMPAAEAQA